MTKPAGERWRARRRAEGRRKRPGARLRAHAVPAETMPGAIGWDDFLAAFAASHVALLGRDGEGDDASRSDANHPQRDGHR